MVFRDTESISHLLKLLDQFKTVSGLEVNASKNEAMWLGQRKNRRETLFNISWPVDPICALGVFFSYDATKAAKVDFDENCEVWKRF